MRRSLIYLNAILSIVAVHGCAMDEIVYPEGYGDGYGNSNLEVAGTYLSLDELKDNPVEVESLAGTYVLKIVSKDKWSLTSSEAWCTPDTKNGFKYTQISLSYVDNPWNDERSAKLQFTLEESGDSFVLDVKQTAAETSIAVNYDNLTFGLPGGETPVTLTTNAKEWQYSVKGADEDNVTDWLSCDLGEGITSGNGSKKIKIKAKGNNTGNERNAVIVFTAEDKTVELPVSQLGHFEAPEIVLHSDKDFSLTWNDIPGVDGYDLVIAKDESFGTVLQTESILAGSNVFNLENLTWKDGYIGKVYMRLIARMTVEGEVMKETSNTVSAHNYFDEESGDGTEASPYRISKPRHLKNVGMFLSAHYIQTADIDLSGIDFEPICTGLNNETSIYEGDFTGTFDGDGKSIRNMSINKTNSTNCGMFARIGQGGTVRNVTLDNPSVTGKVKVGGIAGETLGDIEYCTVKAGSGSKIEGSGELQNFAYLGGITGQQLDGKISHCNNEGVKIEGKSGGLGGIIGKTHAMVTATVTEYTSPVVEYCFNSGEVHSDIKTPLGGIIGDTSGGNPTGETIERYISVKHCHNSGYIHGTQGNNQVGGIIGRTTFETVVYGCSNSGVIEAQGAAGGIVGRMGGNLKYKEISNCLNTGKIVSLLKNNNTNGTAGGIIASGPAAPVLPHITVKNCINIGETVVNHTLLLNSGICVNILQNQNVKFDVTDCFALDKDNVRQLSSLDNFILDPKGYKNISEEAMKSQVTFEGWDFTDVWELTNGKYPTLRSATK